MIMLKKLPQFLVLLAMKCLGDCGGEEMVKEDELSPGSSWELGSSED